MPIPRSCVAVVDDEASVRTMLGRLLRLADFEVAAFSSGEEFLASLADRVPCCVVLDVHMSGLSGLEVQSKLRTMRSDIPAVFITASDDPALDDAVREKDGIALLRKPFSNDDLLAAIATALKRKHAAP